MPVQTSTALNRLYSSSIDWLARQQECGHRITTKPAAPEVAVPGAAGRTGQVRIARVLDTGTGRVVNSTAWSPNPSFDGLLRSFAIPENDPDYGYDGSDNRPPVGYRLEQRSFIYDDALAVLAFSGHRDDRARAILTQLSNLQGVDGSLPFSVDIHLGPVADDYRRAGALAWVGYAAVRYEFKTGSEEFHPFAERIANYLQTLQVTRANGHAADDPRYGSVLAGRGRYDSASGFIDTPMTFASTEHNIDAYFFFRDLANESKDDRYGQVAQLIKQSLLTHHWDAADQRFYQGISLDGPDPGRALDLSSWGGLFLLATGETDKARAVASTLSDFRVSGLSVGLSSERNSFNQTFSSPGPFDGYKPYAASTGYDIPPELIWVEGTWGALLLRLRLGEDISSDLASMRALQAVDPRGGYVQATSGSRRPPYEFHVWPAVGATAWAVIVTGDPAMLWGADGRPDQGQLGQREVPAIASKIPLWVRADAFSADTRRPSAK